MARTGRDKSVSHGLTITSELQLRTESHAGLPDSIGALLPRLAQAPGFQSLRIVQHGQDPSRILFIEDWDSEQAQAAWADRRRTAPNRESGVSLVRTTRWTRLVAAAGRQDAVAAPDGATVTFELELRPEYVEAMTKREENFEVAARWPGFRYIRMLQNGENPARIIHLEQWDNEAAYRGYLDWRSGRGDMEGIRRVASSLHIDVWPTLLAKT